MSTFCGQMQELPNISVDRFDGHNLSSSCFFLSHCHMDHMQGLNATFMQHIGSKKYKFYCSSISKLILMNSKDLHCQDHLIIELLETTVVTVPESSKNLSYNITVTPIPAGHCPGSVMFLFETIQERILYTGDFRISEGDTMKFRDFHSGSNVKVIDKIYFDATFFSMMYWKFPRRKTCVMAMVNVIQEWLNKDSKNVIHLKTSAKYGCEYLYVELAKHFKCLICVSEALYELFWNVPEVGSVLTTDETSSRIRVCHNSARCGVDQVLHIKAAAMWFHWTPGQPQPEAARKYSNSTYKVCYATHSSYSELRDFLTYLKPRALEACTDVYGLTEKQKQKNITDMQNAWSEEPRKVTATQKIHCVLQKKSNVVLKIVDSDEENGVVNVIDSPPRRKKRLP